MKQTHPPAPRIPAAKNAIGDEALYWLFARWSLWSNFHRVWLQQLGPQPQPDRGPYLFYLNHSAWWDGYLMMVTHRLALQRRFDSYVMMEEKQLKAFRFFTWCGAFSINRHDQEDAARSVAYAANLLRERRDRALYIFPQGKIVPNDRRPLVTYPGAARIAAAVADVTLCPIVFRYEFLGQQWPHAFIRIGPAHRPADPENSAAVQHEMAERLTASCDALRDDVLGGRLDLFRPLLQGQLGIDQTFAGFLRLIGR
jgi:chlorobactene lauroyltransferase